MIKVRYQLFMKGMSIGFRNSNCWNILNFSLGISDQIMKLRNNDFIG